MKNLLILIVAVAVYLHFYPQPEVTKFYNQQIGALKDVFAEFGDTKVRLKADKVYTDLQPKLSRFSEKEIEHLKDITSSSSQVKDFYFSICDTTNRDAVFHASNEALVCNTIGKYKKFF